MSIHVGRHCCLWCTITSEQLNTPRATRAAVQLRTLDNLAEKYTDFLNDNGNLKKAKFHQNVIHETSFDIPLIQVKSNKNYMFQHSLQLFIAIIMLM